MSQAEPQPSRPDLEGLSAEQLKDLQSGLQFMIDHIARRIEYAESRRAVLAAVVAGLLAANVAILAMVKDIAFAPLYVALVVFSVCGILLSLLLLIVYGLQINFPYPFVKVAPTMKWFYRYALSDHNAFQVPWYARPSQRVQEDGKHQFTEQWNRFVKERVPELLDPKESTSQDLAQVFVLHVNERYKNLFLTQLRTILVIGVIACVVAAAVGGVITTCVDAAHARTASGKYAKSDFAVESTWSDTSQSRAAGLGSREVQLLVNAQLTNTGSSDIILNGLVPKDGAGLTLPMTVESINPTSLKVAPNSTVNVVAMIWLPVAVRCQLHHFEPAP